MIQQSHCWAYTLRKPKGKRHVYPNVHRSTVYNSQDMEATQMPTDRWMDEEDMVHIYNGTLLSYKKEHIWVNPNEVDESGAYYTEWSKSERQKQISYTNVYIWNLERWYWWTYLQDNSGDADLENRSVDTVVEGEGGTNWKTNTETFTWPYVT